MKYNVFARPMFRRGGMSQGTGITSGLDTPRRNFGNGSGFGFMSQNSQFPIDYLKYGPGKKPGMLTENVSNISNTSTSDGIPKLYNFKSKDPKQFEYPFPSEGYFNKDKIKPKTDYTTTTMADGPPGGGDPDMFSKKPIETANEETLSLISEKAPTKSEEDLLLEKLGDTSLSKGEKALMLSEIIGTAGGLEGKTKKALELAKSKAKQDRLTKRDITKLKYLQKGKERIAGISAGELGSSEKTIEASIRAQKAGAKNVVTGKDGVKTYDGRTEDQIRSEIYKGYTNKDKIGDQLGQTVLARNSTEIIDLQTQIAELESEEKLSTSQEKKLIKKKRRLKKFQDMPGYDLLFPSYKEGGRVNYAEGTPMQEPAIAATQTANANATENTRPVNKLTFSELRNRLPQEITDDVVQLLSKSEEALQDFAYIQTQEDINKFNVKYGVNVMLPPQA